jgi:hypothetical protein
MNYIPAVVWIVLIAFVLTRHIRVYRKYDQQLKIVRKIEAEGGIEDGSTLVALNQRVRYMVRITLAIAGIGIGFGAIYGIHNSGFGKSALFGLMVLTYFYGSEIATGYLTIRDERVISRILEIDQAEHEDAINANTAALSANTQAMDRNTESRDVE